MNATTQCPACLAEPTWSGYDTKHRLPAAGTTWCSRCGAPLRGVTVARLDDTTTLQVTMAHVPPRFPVVQVSTLRGDSSTFVCAIDAQQLGVTDADAKDPTKLLLIALRRLATILSTMAPFALIGFTAAACAVVGAAL